MGEEEVEGWGVSINGFYECRWNTDARFISFFIYIVIQPCLRLYIRTWFLCYRAETSFSYGKKWFGYFKEVSSKSAGCLGISHVVESVLVGRTRGIILHLSKYNYQRIEPSPISTQTVPFKSVASMFKWKALTYATTSLKILCQLPWPCCALQHDCKGGLGLTKSQEIIVSGKQFPSPLILALTKKQMYLILLVLSGVWVPVSIFAFLQFGVFT